MGIVGLLTLGPSLSYLVLWWLSRFYKLDDQAMATIQRDLSARQQTNSVAVDVEPDAVPGEWRKA
ncbi:Uncharacterised protein [Kluyvera cryocrescens]|nr:Uncharacterised protein [Kluyvera cryocrescens]